VTGDARIKASLFLSLELKNSSDLIEVSISTFLHREF
jgi:hypothetical protein